MGTPSSRPVSPHLQIYRPQLTSVLSFAHRVSGMTLGVYSVGLVAWLVAAAEGPDSFSIAQAAIRSWPGQMVMLGGTFCFFLHLCGGIRHLVWDSGRGFELGTIYASGWLVLAVSTLLTLVAWIASSFV